MSGTSADGINVALVHIDEPRRSRETTAQSRASFQLIGHAEYSYPKKVRAAVLAAMNATRASVADLARLNFLLGELYADAILATQHQFRVTGRSNRLPRTDSLSPRRTGNVFSAAKSPPLGKLAKPAIIAARVGAPVVSDFRPADMAAGGKGAPLVPFLDYLLFRDAHIGRIVQNIGGIANLTAFHAGATAEPSDRLRHRPRQHGDRRRHRSAIPPTVRSRRQNRRLRHSATRKSFTKCCSAIFSAKLLPRLRAAKNSAANSFANSCKPADAAANKISSPRPQR